MRMRLVEMYPLKLITHFKKTNKNYIMKKYLFTLFIAVATLSSCSKNDPIPEVDQEELGTAKLTFTPVEVVEVNGNTTYTIIEGEESEEILFTGKQLLPPVGSHIHLHVGETYKMQLETTDFAGRSSEDTFVQRADVHQAFLLNAPIGSLEFVYGDDQVGVTAYITVLKEESSFPLRYVMRHLNNGVKSRIKPSDWNNPNFTQYTGANDLDLKFEAHFVTEAHSY